MRVIGINRFRIDSVEKYAFEGLLMTCNATLLHDKAGNFEANLVQNSEVYASLLKQTYELTKLQQETFNTSK